MDLRVLDGRPNLIHLEDDRPGQARDAWEIYGRVELVLIVGSRLPAHPSPVVDAIEGVDHDVERVRTVGEAQKVVDVPFVEADRPGAVTPRAGCSLVHGAQP